MYKSYEFDLFFRTEVRQTLLTIDRRYVWARIKKHITSITIFNKNRWAQINENTTLKYFKRLKNFKNISALKVWTEGWASK